MKKSLGLEKFLSKDCFIFQVGHAVQEDSPDRLADELARFAVRHKLAAAKPGAMMDAHPPMC